MSVWWQRKASRYFWNLNCCNADQSFKAFYSLSLSLFETFHFSDFRETALRTYFANEHDIGSSNCTCL
ncbi:hypothetical protein RIF29_20999 [Crotalaria pallida]|uniref:Uncharacterized protein n=1 Tax=Crotalaria pallida TaxID=3830 RepID=A0AAN9F2D3_CROPI